MKLLELTEVECNFLLKLLSDWKLKTKTAAEASDVSLALSLAERIEETDDD